MAIHTKPMAARNTGRVYREMQGDYIRELRIEKGMTQTELAAAVGLDNKQDVSGIEVGNMNIPPERVATFAEVFGINPAEFGAKVLSFQNPYLFDCIFGSTASQSQLLAQTEERVGKRRGPRAPKAK